MTDWSTADIPPLDGKTAVITGATGGLGYETALALAGAGATVVLTGRNDLKGRNALQAIRARFPSAKVFYETLDLASLASITDFAGRFAASHAALDILVNNAGVMALPTRQTTADGFEMQFGTNYLGHYALTARLLPGFAGPISPAWSIFPAWRIARARSISMICRARGPIVPGRRIANRNWRC